MKTLEFIILLFCAIIMGGFIVNMLCFAYAIIIDVLRDMNDRHKNNRKWGIGMLTLLKMLFRRLNEYIREIEEAHNGKEF